MTHPKFEVLKTYVETGEPDTVASHAETCEQCTSMIEGIRWASSDSEKLDVSIDQYFDQSKHRVSGFMNITKKDINPLLPFRPWLLSFAATVVLVVSIGIFWNQNSIDLEAYALAQLSANLPSPTMERGSGAGDWHSFVSFYHSGRFDLLTQQYGNTILTELSEMEVYFLGMSYLQLKEPNYHRAAACFELVMAGDGRYDESARWYMAMISIAKSDLVTAKKYLLEISNTPDHFNDNKARELIDSLE